MHFYRIFYSFAKATWNWNDFFTIFRCVRPVSWPPNERLVERVRPVRQVDIWGTEELCGAPAIWFIRLPSIFPSICTSLFMFLSFYHILSYFIIFCNFYKYMIIMIHFHCFSVSSFVSFSSFRATCRFIQFCHLARPGSWTWSDHVWRSLWLGFWKKSPVCKQKWLLVKTLAPSEPQNSW